MKSNHIVTAALIFALAGCSTQANDKISSGGCTIDAKKICQEIANKPVVDSMTGLELDPRERAETQPRTDREHTTFQIPNGPLMSVDCQINTEHNSVVYAHVNKGPQLSDNDWQYIKSAGYCEER